MTPYEIGVKLAQDESYSSGPQSTLGGIAGALSGGLAGAAGGNLLAQHLGRLTRSEVMGIPIPYTGMGEKMFGTPLGPIIGESAGGALGAILGGEAGRNAGQISAAHHRVPRNLVSQDGRVNPMLLDYLRGQNG